MARSAEHARLTLALATLVAILAVAMVSALAAPPTEATPSGTASFRYEVIKFAYSAKGSVNATRESVNCVAGVSHDIGGSATAAPAGLASLDDLGEAELDIERDGTRGLVNAEDYFEYGFNATYRETTSCDGGLVASSAFTNCTSPITALTHAFGLIKGGVGNQVRITWTFSQVDVAGAWIPNLVCGQTIAFLSKERCRSPKTDLELLTRKVVKLRFVCDVPLTTAIPAGTGYDHFEGFSQVSGVIKLQRLKN